ncbi:MAG: hypothetical protein ACKO72_08120 [Actinomycetes bacterium]
MQRRRSSTLPALVLTGLLAMAAVSCGGTESDPTSATTSTSAVTGPGGLTGPPANVPFSLGTRAAFGDWELAVDSATIGTTTTIGARLRNTKGGSVPAPTSSAFVLSDGATPTDATAVIAGLPPRMAPGVDSAFTITFVNPVAPGDPYLRWNGTGPDAIVGSFKLTPGDPVQPLD